MFIMNIVASLWSILVGINRIVAYVVTPVLVVYFLWNLARFVVRKISVRFRLPENRQNLTVLITGGNSGIGFDLAKHFVSDGFGRVIIVGRNEDRLQTSKDSLEKLGDAEIFAFQKDLSVPGAALELYTTLQRRDLDNVDVLVNNAGFGHFYEFRDSDPEVVENVIGCNATSLVLLTRFVLPGMITRKFGRIMFVSSILGSKNLRGHSVYCATKAFVDSFAIGLGFELRGLSECDISITNLRPGATSTRFASTAVGIPHEKYTTHSAPMTSGDVAKSGYEGLFRGDDIVFPSFKNWFAVNVIPQGYFYRMTAQALDIAEEQRADAEG